MSTSSMVRRKLVLHMDVNNTVLIGDSITKQISLEEILNEYITGVIWGSVDENGTWKARDTSLYTRPPRLDLICYYKFAEASFARAGRTRGAFAKHIRNFTEEEAGKPFRIYYEKMQDHLKFAGHISDQGKNIDEALILKDSKGNVYHRIIPSFFKLLVSLLESRRDFTVIFRTFGDDGNAVLKGTEMFLKGLHPCLPAAPPNDVEIKLEPGMMNRSGENMSLSVPNEVTTSAPREIYDYLTGSSAVQLVVDDFSWWREQGYQQFAGKPLLLDLQDNTVHHIMFDDNIRVWDPQNSIVDVQIARHGQGMHTFQRANPENCENVCVVKADLYQSICNKDYFIEKVQECEQSYPKFLEDSLQNKLL